MIVDASAVVAILLQEPEGPQFYQLIREARTSSMCAATYVELGIVIDTRPSPALSNRLDTLLNELETTVAPLTERQAKIARQAYRDFGKNSGSAARLNFGDCFSYALAKDLDEPLLFKGDDFIHTDVRRVVPAN